MRVYSKLKFTWIWTDVNTQWNLIWGGFSFNSVTISSILRVDHCSYYAIKSICALLKSHHSALIDAEQEFQVFIRESIHTHVILFCNWVNLVLMHQKGVHFMSLFLLRYASSLGTVRLNFCYTLQLNASCAHFTIQKW